MSKIIVFGASGQLGACLKVVSEKQNISDINFLPEEQANILDVAGLEAIFKSETPAYCINCAAYTAVDKAEDEVDLARRINRDGAENLATLCKQFNATLIHISTDFVFEGNLARPLTELDEARPINVYGLTKLEGEHAIESILNKYYILRTSWLYSEFGNNFVKTMMRLGAEKDELRIIADQIGTPTYAIDLAHYIFHIIENDNAQYGLYHYSNEGVCSWYDFAKAIFDIADIKVNTLPIRGVEYVTKAIRPGFSVMDKSKVKGTFGLEIPYWRDSLVECVGKLKSQN
ncbi:dTDP-4-dehydrorhamnose reductase [Paradesertivirga mongoliensis]|uniref:dTDP-4-dehydrorhamnose reductase n=1 Tax=Paradesertivirga mongoliensis TaxID=2100740 RepID=A0ABW4ZJ02_9SPHI|nr:dTDP-4-dehydrorhamnose reductase [Pedobacter mongoliensis]